MSARKLQDDSLDCELVEQCTKTRGYQLISLRLSHMLETKLRDLRGSLDQAGTERARGYLDAIERCLELPEILMKEFREKPKKR